MFTKIAIIGTGNVGSYFYQTLNNQPNLEVKIFSGRKINELTPDFDLYIFSLKDDIYNIVLQEIPFTLKNAVHTSGSLSKNIFVNYAKNFGVFYPYQTINKNNLPLNLPICIEGNDENFENSFLNFATNYFPNVIKVTESQRFAMHLAAVFANNFSNAMFGVAYKIFKENNLHWELIFPLLEQTIENAKNHNPTEIQTGPAKRNDQLIIEKHCKELNNNELVDIYKIISQYIKNNYK